MSFGIDFSPDCFLSKNTYAQTLNPPLLLRKPKRLSCLHQASPVHLAIVLLLAATGYRFWFSTRLELVPDEAYYWLWSKHLAASYRNKGPAIAWTIALGTRMFGDSVFGIRFFAVLLSTGRSWPAGTCAWRAPHCFGAASESLTNRLHHDRDGGRFLVTIPRPAHDAPSYLSLRRRVNEHAYGPGIMNACLVKITS
jgi:hypothetical protein